MPSALLLCNFPARFSSIMFFPARFVHHCTAVLVEVLGYYTCIRVINEVKIQASHMHTAVVHERTRVYKSSPIQIIHVHAVHAVNLVLL